MDINELIALLANGDRSYDSLASTAQSDLSTLLRPIGGFAAEQRNLLGQYWLKIPLSQSELDALNEGQNNRIPGRLAEDGFLYCPAKLLTDTRPAQVVIETGPDELEAETVIREETYHWAIAHLNSWLIVPTSLITFPPQGELV